LSPTFGRLKPARSESLFAPWYQRDRAGIATSASPTALAADPTFDNMSAKGLTRAAIYYTLVHYHTEHGGFLMLVLSRKENERIKLGDSIVVTVVRVGRDKVRLGIEAPSDMLVLREELEATPPAAAPATENCSHGLSCQNDACTRPHGLSKAG